ncbi:putative pre-mRNA-splicing factor ATP-dependent RNA helicase DEAH9 [Araneus ventricosus]|uniref:Putative pre-mRNA-splicing factor ATP-dependent RNA helicase DEAH9 n=1 Tax=Araneus ventricosus TaxID=182803 RepID=A0A4Y2EJV4_ARAVE|nr:putative pre-mRNA-splicing factor ATP-dependent RNA helicase DEAH9 [Araneus ventricosus]
MNIPQLCSSLDVVLHYRQEIDKLSEVCITKLYSEVEKKRKMLIHKKYSKDLEQLIHNLSLQLKQFEKVISKLKIRLSSVCALKLEDAIQCSEKIKHELLYECKLFENFFQAYGFRDDVITFLKDNQVNIVVADSSCCFHMVLPLLIRAMFPHQTVVSCESCEILKRGLCYWLSNFLGEKLDMNLFNEKGFVNDISCLSEKQLLNYFVDSRFVVKQAVVIFNVPLVRSIESDLLLSYLRDMVVANRDSRLILLISPYTDLNSYQNYFSLISSGVQILKTLCISFPVKTVWRKDSLTPLEDYVSQVVHTIMSILALHDFGDILAFLPNYSDLKQAAEMLRKQLINFRYNDVEYFLIYENSFYNIDYNLSPNSRRKVFLSTDCSEATVFPSVKFVVDSGIRKSVFYDQLLKKEVLKSTFISCREARLRKSMAGKFSNGICYRIYNKENYFMDMPQKDCPEILRVNPCTTMIKVIQYRSGKALQFVEFFPKHILRDVVNDLQKYEALKGNSLSPMGKDMGKLPFQLQYSKLILLALKKGFAFESVVLVAFFCNKQRIFVHTMNETQQKSIYAMKLQLAMNESDTFLYLSIYKNWIESNFSSVWCKNHFINPNTMRKIHSSVLEICDIISNCLGKKIIPEFSDFQNYYLDLTEILFECFFSNLCVYTGYFKSGYRVLSSSLLAFIHPESVTYQTESAPQFILYDQMICNKKTTIFHITVVPNDIIMKALMNGMLPYENEDLFDASLRCRTIEPVGEELMNDLLLGPDGKKLRMIEENIKKECGSDLVFLEASINKGCVYVYALPDYVDFAQCFVQDILKSKFNGILSENQLEILELKYNQNKICLEINWSKGAVATNLYLKSQSEIVNTFHQDYIATETLDNFSDAHYFPYQLFIAWIRRPCSGKGYINFNSAEGFRIARKLALRNITIFGCDIFIQASKKRENQLYITGLPPETNANILKQELQLLIPNSMIDSIELEYKPPFKMVEDDIISLSSVIADVCKEFTILGEFDVTVPKPDPKDLDMVVYIDVLDNEALSLIAEVLSGIVVRNKKFITKILYNLVVKCDKELCKVLKHAFITELERIKQDIKNFSENNNDFEIGCSIDLESEEKALIKISSDNNEILSLLHRKVNDLLAGEMLSSQTVKDLDNIFFYGGQVWLKNLERAENVRIVMDNKMKTLTLYGSHTACDNVKCQIAMFLEDAENHVIQTISLSTEENSSMLLKAVIKKYGVDLEHFIQSCDLHSAALDIKAHQLLVRGSSKSIEKAEECIKALSDELDIIIPDVGQSHEICPVCVCPAYNLTFRLEHCGHLYCLECIQALVEQAQFPVRCCAENCFKDIVVKDIRKILKDDPVKIKTLLENSMKDYLERNRENIFYCPAPDCSMFFYKKELSANKLNCPLCKNDICTKCNVIYHGGYTCDMYQNSKKDADYSFKVWQKTTTRCKQCPRCKTAIEKIAGCNHMTCASCKQSFCWEREGIAPSK